jgi:predicted NAD/FAD-dependent oxidoreductase/ribosomal protein S18 acetylase RimI-like enzyme
MGDMTGDIQIELLTGHHHLAPVLAEWHHAEFGHLYEPHVWNREIGEREFLAMAEPDPGDVTWVAFDGGGRDADDVLGSVSLIATDDLAGFEHLTPWLASLYIAPHARDRGIGSQLVATTLAGAAERGHRYVHLFTAGQEQYYLDRGWRTLAHVDRLGSEAAVMAKATAATGARRAVTSHWCGNPDTNGAYSYLRPGGRPGHRDVLAGPILPGLWFAGEACSTRYPATMHGAWFSGQHAADHVLSGIEPGDTVLIVGCGLAGIAAARRLTAAGHPVAMVEATDRPGGRAVTDTSLGVPCPLGGAWLHGDDGHPLASYVTTVREDWGDALTYVVGHGRVGDDDTAAALAARPRVEAAFAASRPGDTAAGVLDAAIASIDDLTDLQRTVLEGWFVREIENLFAGPIGDFAADTGFEEYELPGDDCLITSNLQPVIEHLAAGLDVRFRHRVGSLDRDAHGTWHTDTGMQAAQVIVTAPIAALRTGRIAFEPPLPPTVLDAFEHIGAGPITKLFATYDSVWWPLDRPIRVIGSELLIAVDMSPLTGTPVLCWFATGEAARRIETLTEDECCRLADRVARECGLSG